jgi:hypothetical protein
MRCFSTAILVPKTKRPNTHSPAGLFSVAGGKASTQAVALKPLGKRLPIGAARVRSNAALACNLFASVSVPTDSPCFNGDEPATAGLQQGEAREGASDYLDTRKGKDSRGGRNTFANQTTTNGGHCDDPEKMRR